MEWIPIERMIPDKTGAYLVSCANGNVKVGHFSTFDNKWSDAKAVAWMPLPKPYTADTPHTDAKIPKNALRSDCTGCRFVGTYDTEFPYANCVRKNKDYYDPE